MAHRTQNDQDTRCQTLALRLIHTKVWGQGSLTWAPAKCFCDMSSALPGPAMYTFRRAFKSIPRLC